MTTEGKSETDKKTTSGSFLFLEAILSSGNFLALKYSGHIFGGEKISQCQHSFFILFPNEKKFLERGVLEELHIYVWFTFNVLAVLNFKLWYQQIFEERMFTKIINESQVWGPVARQSQICNQHNPLMQWLYLIT